MAVSCTSNLRLALLGGFGFYVGVSKSDVPLGAQRLLALLALSSKSGISRCIAAERLWPDATRRRASANLRSALWQSRCIGSEAAVMATGGWISLSPTVEVDYYDAVDSARRIANSCPRLEPRNGHEATIAALSWELLPDWSDDWILLDRERWDQIRLHALESLARHLMSAEKYLFAIEAALAAVAIEPVRESAHRTVIEIFIAQDNAACALKHYQQYRRFVQDELGVTPSRRMIGLVQPIRST